MWEPPIQLVLFLAFYSHDYRMERDTLLRNTLLSEQVTFCIPLSWHWLFKRSGNSTCSLQELCMNTWTDVPEEGDDVEDTVSFCTSLVKLPEQKYHGGSLRYNHRQRQIDHLCCSLSFLHSWSPGAQLTQVCTENWWLGAILNTYPWMSILASPNLTVEL